MGFTENWVFIFQKLEKITWPGGEWGAPPPPTPFHPTNHSSNIQQRPYSLAIKYTVGNFVNKKSFFCQILKVKLDTVQHFWPLMDSATVTGHDHPNVLQPQSNELTRGPPELVQHFAYRGNSHRRESAACPKFDMVWLYHSPIPVGRRGIISSFKWFLPAFATRRGRGRGVRSTCLQHSGIRWNCVELSTQKKATLAFKKREKIAPYT